MAKHLTIGLILLVVVSLSTPGVAQWQYFGELILATDTPNMANPIASIMSAAMMLRYSFNLVTEAQCVEDAMIRVLEDGYRTYDIMSEGKTKVGTKEMGDLIAGKITES